MLSLDDSMEEWEKIIYENHHSYYPVCDGTVADIYGVLHVRDYLLLKDRSRENVLDKAVNQAYFVPYSIRADLLFDNMKNTGHYFAIVLEMCIRDRYNGEILPKSLYGGTVLKDGDSLEVVSFVGGG